MFVFSANLPFPTEHKKHYRTLQRADKPLLGSLASGQHKKTPPSDNLFGFRISEHDRSACSTEGGRETLAVRRGTSQSF
jgi:hypothetical protein